MVARALARILHREVRGLHQAAYVLAFFTLGSQLFALLRDRLLAHTFGASETLDVFYAAFRIPDTLYALLASTVSLFVLIPFLEAAAKKGAGEVREFLSDTFSFFTATLALCAGVAFVFASEVVAVLYAGFDTGMQEQLVPVVRVLLLQPLLLGVSNLCAAYVQLRGRFVLYASAPILYNIGIIVGVLFFAPGLGTVGLAWGVVLGALLHLGVQVPFVVSHGVWPRLRVPDWAQVWEVVRLSIPRTITLSTQQLVLLILVSAASFFAAGSIASFTFAWNLTAVPLALIGVSYSVAAFPTLARLYGDGDVRGYRALIVSAARQIIFWAIPATVLFIVLRAHIVRVLLGTGKFDWDATMMTAALLALLTISLVAQGLVVLLVRACYAAGRTLVPLVLNVGSAVLTVGVAFGLLYAAREQVFDLQGFAALMRVPEVLGPELLLLALAFSIGSCVNMVLLVIYFEVRTKQFVRLLARTTLHALLASCGAGLAAYGTLHLLDGLISLDTTLGVFMQGVLAGIAGLLVWVAVLLLLKNEDVRTAWGAVHKKLSKDRVQETRGSLEG